MGMKMPEGVNPNLQAMQGGVVESFFASMKREELSQQNTKYIKKILTRPRVLVMLI